ncbi:hypothetical protein [Mesorhizobium sp. AR10]|uniref:hypothetical protein n=1 Tax=Mesorhizobium sp. AR10 TaxID=2865839 RepID=UPI00215E7907|nr:hypothetical protein [Mesorhizobium sp. AR10]
MPLTSGDSAGDHLEFQIKLRGACKRFLRALSHGRNLARVTKMAVAKKDQERLSYAWMYVAQARKHGKERVVPPFWDEYGDAWQQGFDGEPLAAARRGLSAINWRRNLTKARLANRLKLEPKRRVELYGSNFMARCPVRSLPCATTTSSM